MLGIIGVGAAGNNIADIGEENGIKSIAINYSSMDIGSLVHVKERLILNGSEGVGKNRELSKQLMENNWEMAVNFIKEHMSTPSIEVILVCFSCGGGSGGGASPLLIDLLQNEMPDKVFVACPILPDNSEVIVNQINTLSVFEELENMNVCILPIDNEEVKQKYNPSSKSKLYECANGEFIRLLAKLQSYTEKSSKNGIVDKKDLLQMFDTSGISLISESNIGDISNLKISEQDFSNKIKQSWEQSIFTNIENQHIMRASIIFDGQETLMQYLNFDSIFKGFMNMPIDLFEGYYENNQSCTVISFLSGLSWITTRLQTIDGVIEKKQQGVILDANNKNKTKNRFKEFNSKIRKTSQKKTNVSDILSKYKR